MATVSLLRCESYAAADLKRVIRQSLTHIGFDPQSFRHARVALKPNLLMPARAERAITTHPEFFRAVVEIVKEHQGHPVLIESPAVHSLGTVIRKTDYAPIVAEYNVEVLDPAPTKTLVFDGARAYRRIDVSSGYFDADILISLPKFKTHGVTYITGGVKLLFGMIPGLAKSRMHFRLPSHDDFADFLLDLYGAVRYGFNPPKPLLNLMDAVVVQEGEGPGPSGKPRAMNAILAAENAIALDYVATSVAGLDVSKAPTIVRGFERGYGVDSPAAIEVAGDSIESLRLSDFQPARGSSLMSNAFRWPVNTRTFKRFFLERPVPRTDRCTLCGQCRKICPAEAISAPKKRRTVPHIDYGTCIRCYCCLEICPAGAIEKQKGLFG